MPRLDDGTATPPAASRRTRSADVRDALVDAAVRVLERDGLAALTVRAVAAEAGVAPMGVYNHLQGKNGLMVAVLARGFDGLRAAVTTRPGAPVDQRLTAAGVGYREFARANPITYGLMFSGHADPEVHERVAPHADPALAALIGLVAEAQRVGFLRQGDPEVLAMHIWSAVHGAVSLELAGACPEGHDPEMLYRGLTDAILRGLAPA